TGGERRSIIIFPLLGIVAPRAGARRRAGGPPRATPPCLPARFMPMRRTLWCAAALTLVYGGEARADWISYLSTGADPVTGSLLPTSSADAKYTVAGPGGAPFTPQVRTQDSLPTSYLTDDAMPGSRWDYV